MLGRDNAGIRPLLQIHAHECDMQLIKSQYEVTHIAHKFSCQRPNCTSIAISGIQVVTSSKTIEIHFTTNFKTIEGL